MKAQFNIGDRVTIRVKRNGTVSWALSGRRGEVINTSHIGGLIGKLVHLIRLADDTRHWVRPEDLSLTPVIDSLADIGDKT